MPQASVEQGTAQMASPRARRSMLVPPFSILRELAIDRMKGQGQLGLLKPLQPTPPGGAPLASMPPPYALCVIAPVCDLSLEAAATVGRFTGSASADKSEAAGAAGERHRRHWAQRPPPRGCD